MKTKKKQKPYWEMTTEELAEATKQFDKPIRFEDTRPLSPKQRALFERAQRSPSRSIFISRGTDGVLVRIEPKLLKRCTRYAAEHKITLSEVVNRSLRGMLAMIE